MPTREMVALSAGYSEKESKRFFHRVTRPFSRLNRTSSMRDSLPLEQKTFESSGVFGQPRQCPVRRERSPHAVGECQPSPPSLVSDRRGECLGVADLVEDVGEIHGQVLPSWECADRTSWRPKQDERRHDLDELGKERPFAEPELLQNREPIPGEEVVLSRREHAARAPRADRPAGTRPDKAKCPSVRASAKSRATRSRAIQELRRPRIGLRNAIVQQWRPVIR